MLGNEEPQTRSTEDRCRTDAGIGHSGARRAREQPIRVGFSIAQTGPIAGGGQAALVALRLWADDVNARGGLLGRKVELVVYDDQGSPAMTPGIYAKLIDIDKVDLLIAPYGTVPTAPIVPLARQRKLLLMGNFSFQVNARIQHDMWFNNAPWNDASSWSEGFFKIGQAAGGENDRLPRRRQRVRPESRQRRARACEAGRA